MASSMIRDMTKGPVVPQLLRFAMPLFVSNALQAVYNLVDMVVVGNYINGSGRSGLNFAIAVIDGIVSRIGLAALLGFSLHMDCFGFWMGDALAGFMPLVIGGVFFLSGRWMGKAIRRYLIRSSCSVY